MAVGTAGAGRYPLDSLQDDDLIYVDRSDSAYGNYISASGLAAYVTAEYVTQPYLNHTGGALAVTSTSGVNTTPVTTSSYMTIVTIPGDTTITGVAMLNALTSSGSVKHYLANVAGEMLASTASTAFGASSTYQRVAFTESYSAKGPATYILVSQFSSVSDRFRTHLIGDFPTWSSAGTTFGTFPTVTLTSTFITGVGPVASLY